MISPFPWQGIYTQIKFPGGWVGGMKPQKYQLQKNVNIHRCVGTKGCRLTGKASLG